MIPKDYLVHIHQQKDDVSFTMHDIDAKEFYHSGFVV
jgi:hypothetical protein